MADDLESLLKASPLSQAQRANVWDAYQNASDPDALAAALQPLTIPKTVKASLWDLKSKTSAPPEAPAAQPDAPPRTWGETAMEVGKGVLKGAGRTVLGAGEALLSNPVFGTSTMALDAMRAVPEVKATETRVRSSLENKNVPQSVGGALETGAEMLVPLGAAAEAIPTTAKAGAKFQQVMGAARNIPVDINAPGQVALRINELAERGGSMPMVVRKFLNRVTDPNKPGLVYEEARDFASNISRLSANEYQRLTPVVAREVANLRVVLNKAVADAAGQAGKGAEYAQAMNEYARAMKIRGVIDNVVSGVKRSAPYATAAGAGTAAGYWVSQHLKDLLGE